MTDPTPVGLLGAIAGLVWMCAAIYFQMIRQRSVYPGYISALFLIGVALLMSSSAIALDAAGLIEALAIGANLLFILLGVGVWIVLERAADIHDRQQTEETVSGD